jgi:adenylyl-sulfate kinase
VPGTTGPIHTGSDNPVVWLTGLPCAGKSTIASLVDHAVRDRGRRTCVLDGDVVRRSTSVDLDFSEAGRCEQARRVAVEAVRASDDGRLPIVAVVSPFHSTRATARAIVGDALLEVYVDAPVGVCEERDVKGMYARARAGAIDGFTGVSSSYEPPEAPALHVHTDEEEPAESAARVVALLEALGVL